jgi:D-xylose transport system permease protein
MAVETAPAPNAEAESSGLAAEMRQAWHDYVDRVKGGDIGALPAVLGIIALVIIFTVLRPETFPTAFNFANLLNQGAMVMVIAMGLVFVLLLGEIDLSAGFTAGTSGAILAVALSTWGLPWYFSVLVCIVVGAVIGLVIGSLVSRLGIPSFVVTLAFFLGLQGAMLLIIGEGGTIRISDPTILAVMNDQMPIWLGWVLAVVVVGGFGLVGLRQIANRRKLGLPATSPTVLLAKVLVLGVLIFAGVFVLSQERSRNVALTSIKGVPWVVLLVLVLLVVATFVLHRTSFGRHVYAVGGSSEAARRAGISVARIRTICFVTCSSFAATAGILFASRDNSVSPSTGGSTTLLFAVGAAVIGGTSLFGGRGRPRDGILGGLVVAIIANGMALLNQKAGVVFIVTGSVLLIAASVDAISRRRAAAAGG